MKAGDRLFCDTNVLLSAVDTSRKDHERALHVLNTYPQRGGLLVVSGQVIREFLVVSTRPVENNGLGQTPEEAVENIESMLDRMTVLEETRDVATLLQSLVQTRGCVGKTIHDANIAATAMAHGVGTVLTANPGDFSRFGDIDVLPLFAA